jgi:hypothetical protein
MVASPSSSTATAPAPTASISPPRALSALTSTKVSACCQLDMVPFILIVFVTADPNLPFMRVTKKHIPRGNSRLDILGEDLLLHEERDRYAEKPTLKSSVANVGLPAMAKWKHMLMGSYEDLYIVWKSHALTPPSSKNNSPENSQFVSPASTFPAESALPPQSMDV